MCLQLQKKLINHRRKTKQAGWKTWVQKLRSCAGVEGQLDLALSLGGKYEVFFIMT